MPAVSTVLSSSCSSPGRDSDGLQTVGVRLMHDDRSPLRRDRTRARAAASVTTSRVRLVSTPGISTSDKPTDVPAVTSVLPTVMRSQ